MTVARTGHPLDGQRLRVDPFGSRRHDGRLQVLLPDGSAALLPLAWLSTGTPGAPAAARGAAPQRFSADGLRRLLRLVDRLRGVTGRPESGK